MKRRTVRRSLLLLIIVTVLCAGCGMGRGTKDSQKADMRELTDMAGRTVRVPETIERVFSAGPEAAIYTYTVDPDLLLGWNYPLNDLEKSMILEKYHTLPSFGMGDSINYEAVIAAGPDIALYVDTVSDAMAEACDELSAKLGIPVVAVDGDLLASADAFRFLGELLNRKEQAEALAAYAEETFRAVEQTEIPDEKKVRIYYGNGEDSLETAPVGSPQATIFEVVKARNVAKLEMGSGARVQISAEQLLAWDPDVILVNGEPKANISGAAAADVILSDPDYSTLKAVQNGKVFGTPNAPFSWIERPPGPNRIVGVRWLFGLLYPECIAYDVDAEVKEFFRLFYHISLSDEELPHLYRGGFAIQ